MSQCHWLHKSFKESLETFHGEFINLDRKGATTCHTHDIPVGHEVHARDGFPVPDVVDGGEFHVPDELLVSSAFHIHDDFVDGDDFHMPAAGLRDFHLLDKLLDIDVHYERYLDQVDIRRDNLLVQVMLP